MSDFPAAFNALVEAVAAYGVRVALERMDVELPGRFDGHSITVNTAHDVESRCYYLAHSFGSIVLWSMQPEETRRVFDDLRDAKKKRREDPHRLDDAIERFSTFEDMASEYAVALLAAAGQRHLIDGYTEFFRADLDAMQQFHRTGTAPRWPEFFTEWKARVARGEKLLKPYPPRAIPPFKPVRIQPEQEVVQERDGER